MSFEGEGVGAELLMSPARRRVMDLLVAQANSARDEDPDGRRRGMTASELAEELDLHVTTVRFHLDQLLSSGLLTAETQRGQGAGRPSKVYIVNPGSLADLQVLDHRVGRAFEKLAGLLARNWIGPDGKVLSAEEAGRRWSLEHTETFPEDVEPARTPGQWLNKIGRMVDTLAEWGYTAEISTSHGGRHASIRLHDCPFLDMARDRPDVVCAVHRGLIDGAMAAVGERPTVSLEPFVSSRECLAHVTRQPFPSSAASATER